MDNYQSLGLDPYLFNLNSPLVQRDNHHTGFDFDTNYERGVISSKSQVGSGVIGSNSLVDL